MPIMELVQTNEEFAAAASDLIDLNGLAKGEYYNKRVGCYCTLGAFRTLIFGHPLILGHSYGDPRMKRYLELVYWLANQIGNPSPIDGRSGEAVVSNWNDGNDKQTVVAKLREVGRAA